MHAGVARWLQVLLVTLWSLLISNAYAATQTYQLYIDADQQAATGCPVTLTDRAGSVRSQGHEYRLTVSVDDAGAASAPLLAACSAGSFGADAAVGSVAPTSTFVSTGTALTDQLELAVPLAAIGNPPRFGVLLASQGDYLGQGTGSAPIALTQSALISGADIASGVTSIPSLGAGATVLLALLLVWSARRHLRTVAPMGLLAGVLSAALLLTGLGAAWAAGLIALDGQMSDWQGRSAVAVDALGDQRTGTPDLDRLYAAIQKGQLFLRIDAQGNNHAPRFLDAAPAAQQLRIGQAWQLSLRARDPDGDPLTWQLVDAPSGFGVSNTGVLSATPTQAGSFTLRVRVSDPSGAFAQQAIALQVSAGASGGAAHQVPRFDSTPATQATVGQAWRYDVSAVDPNTPVGPITLALTRSPAGMTLSGQTLQWLPTTAGSYAISLRATDDQGAQSSQSWDLLVGAADPARVERELSPTERASELPRFVTQPSLQLSAGQSWHYEVRATDAAGRTLSVRADSLPAGMRLAGSAPGQTLDWTPTGAGTASVSLSVIDDRQRTQVQRFTLEVADERQLPASPATQAPQLKAAGSTPFADANAFLYTGSNPIQTGVAADAIDPVRMAVLRGKVLDRAGQPVAAVRVRIAGHPEWGQTATRADGWFDLAANGGGSITLQYEKPGYLTLQRKLSAPWRDWVIADDVVLTARSAQYSDIDLSAAAGSTGYQVGWGENITDSRGTRRAVTLFPPGTQAQMRLPDASTRPLTQLTYRATEYTVGATGPAAMPGELPASVGYTYAVDLSVDEAVAAGARRVEFSQPLAVYVHNFNGAPIGSAVPKGWYDSERAAWIGEDNGRVLRIRSVHNGVANLQVTAQDRDASADELQALGITEEERRTVAQLYAPGTSLWRVTVSHFTPWDCNWPWGPPQDAEPPPATPEAEPPCDGSDCPCPGDGCDIHFGARAVGQRIALRGTPHSLYYRSDRVTGPRGGSSTRITGNGPPASLLKAQLSIDIAGVRRQFDYEGGSLSANLVERWPWDGRDAYGRVLQDGANARQRVTYDYAARSYAVVAEWAQAFDRLDKLGSQVSSFDRSTARFTLVRETNTHVSAPPATLDVVASGAGYWAITGLSLYDPSQRKLYRFGGEHQSTHELPRAFTPWYEDPDDLPTAITLINANSAGGHFATLAYSQAAQHRIYALSLGTDPATNPPRRRLVAGTGAPGYSGDGAPAQAAQFSNPGALTSAPDGSLYVMDRGNRRLRRIGIDGIVSTVAGNGQRLVGTPAMGNATELPFEATQLAALPDGNLLAIGPDGQLMQLSASGQIYTMSVPADSGVARDIASDAQGRVWLAAAAGLHTLDATGWRSVFTGDLRSLFVDAVGGLYFMAYDDKGLALNHMDSGGAVQTITRDNLAYWGVGRNLVLPDQRLLALSGRSIGDYGSMLSPYGATTYRIAQRAGTLVDEFDRQGRQIATRSAFNGAVLARYQYTADGYLQSSEDGAGNRVQFLRAADKQLTSVISADGLVTTLTYNADGALASVTEPGGATHRMGYASDLGPSVRLSSYQDPRGGVDQFSYDSTGALTGNLAPNGGGWRLRADGNTIEASTGEGRVRRITSNRNAGVLAVSDQAFDGTVTQATRRVVDNYRTQTNPDGSHEERREEPDPRFGLASPLTSSATTWASGAIVEQSVRRKATQTVATDPYSLSYWEQSSTVNQATQTIRYQPQGSGGLFTAVLPSGRQATAQVDALMRPTQIAATGEPTLHYGYDSRGRISSLTASSGNTQRATQMSYHPTGAPGAGQLASVTDAMGQTSSYAYDSAGHLSTSTYDGRTLSYAYDAAGNLTSLSTDAGAAHVFDYTAKDDLSDYQAPAVAGVATPTTRWTFNRDRLLMSMQRPGGLGLQWTRDAASGKALRLADGVSGTQTTYSYQADGHLKTLSTSTGQSIGLRYNAALPVAMDLNLAGVAASIAVSYERPDATHIDLRPARIDLTTAGATSSLSLRYNADEELTASGPVAFGRNSATGRIASVLVGATASTLGYNDFGEPLESSTVVQNVSFASDSAARSAVQARLNRLYSAIGDEITRQNCCTVPWPDLSYLNARKKAVEPARVVSVPTSAIPAKTAVALAPSDDRAVSSTKMSLVPGMNATISNNCAIHQTGTRKTGIFCWPPSGYYWYWTEWVRFEPQTPIGHLVSLSTSLGGGHGCAVTDNGGVWCWGWGWNSQGELGNGSATETPDDDSYLGKAVAAVGITSAQAVTVGYHHSCALLRDGTVQCWGRNREGQLGQGRRSAFESVPLNVPGLTGVQSLAAGKNFTCAVKSDASLWCWGDGGWGDGGWGEGVYGNDDMAPRLVAALTDPVRAVAAGPGGVCVLMINGTVRCNNFYEAPVMVDGLTNVKAVTVGGSHACALLNDTTMRCWGRNSHGQLGNGTKDRDSSIGSISRGTPVTVLDSAGQPLSGVTSITAGRFSHSCAMQTAGHAVCWGQNHTGELGIKDDRTDRHSATTPVSLPRSVTLVFNGGGIASDQPFTEVFPTPLYPTPATFNFTLDPGYSIDTVQSSCGGSLSVSGLSFTTDSVSEDCTVTVNTRFNNSFQVTATAGAGGSVSPASQTVIDGATAAITVTPEDGYLIDQMTSSCGGSLQGESTAASRFSTAPVHGDCSITASFKPIPSYPSTPSAPAWQPMNFCLSDLGKSQAALDAILADSAHAGNSNWASRLSAALSDLSRRYAQGAAGFIPGSYPRGEPVSGGPFSSASLLTAEAQALIGSLQADLANMQRWQYALKRSHQRDALGRLTRSDEVVQGQQGASLQYGYSAGGHLQSVSVFSGPDGSTALSSTTWGYDRNDNRVSENGQTVAEYDAQDRLLRWKDNRYSYTAAGELQSRTTPGGTTSYRYDAQGNLLQVRTESGRQIDYAIDPANRRVGKQIDGQWQWRLVWLDALRPLAQLNNDGSVESLFHYGDQPNVPEAMEKAGVLYRLVTDERGSVRLVVNANTGEVAQRLDYDVWGRAIDDTNPGFQPFGYAGGLYDPDTQLVRFGARDYDGQTGRWTAKDPILFWGGDSNLYAYVGGNPISYYDPYGLWAWGDLIPQGVVDFSAGFGDTVSFGLTNWARNQMGTNGAVNKCSGDYTAGEVAGVAVDTVIGGAAGWEAAGAKGAGKEFSHWIPKRMGGPRSKWNGNYVTPAQHYYHDPFRYPQDWRQLGDKSEAWVQQLDRIPKVYKGGAAGAAAGAGGMGMNDCGCQ